MIIVDSSVWIDYLYDTVNCHTKWLDDAIGNEEIGLTSLIMCEVLQGIRDEAQFCTSRRALLRLPVFDNFSAELTITSAQNYRTLRREGVAVRKTIDCLIATFCIEHGHQLLHKDRDFDAFEDHLGLHVLHPPALALN